MSFESKNIIDWERYVRPNFKELVEKLKPSSLLDSLVVCDLLTREECSSLRLAFSTEEDRSREFLLQILPRKENDAFIHFCRVLLNCKGQEHIVTEVMKIPSTHPARAPLQSKSKQQVCMRVSNLLF